MQHRDTGQHDNLEPWKPIVVVTQIKMHTVWLS